MIGTHPITPAIGGLVGSAVLVLALPALPLPAATLAWVVLGVAAGYSISGSP